MNQAAAEQRQETYKVSRKDLPLACPRPGAETWALHPKVFLPIKKTGEATCPYCGAHYVLEG